MTNRFPLPWSIEEQDRRFVVRDKNGRALHTVYFEDEPKRCLFTRDEARYIRSLSKMPAASLATSLLRSLAFLCSLSARCASLPLPATI